MCTLTTSVFELLCAFMAFSCTFPITASAHSAIEIKTTPKKKKLFKAGILFISLWITQIMTCLIDKDCLKIIIIVITITIIIYFWLMTWEVVPNLPSKWDMEATAYQYGWTQVGQCCLLRWRVLSQYSYSGKPENQGVCRIFLQTKKKDNFPSSLLRIKALQFILKWSLITS